MAGRPPTKPLKKEGRYTYVRLADRLICFPTETASEQDIASIRAINAGYAKGLDQELSTEQHRSLMKLLCQYTIAIGV